IDGPGLRSGQARGLARGLSAAFCERSLIGQPAASGACRMPFAATRTSAGPGQLATAGPGHGPTLTRGCRDPRAGLVWAYRAHACRPGGPSIISEQDRIHLRRCVELATSALNAGDEPFGSVLVSADGQVLFEDRNRVAGGDHTRH